MAQITFVDGDVLTAANLNTYCAGEGGAWTSWTPAITQNGAVTSSNTRSRYARYGRTIHFSLSVSITGTGTGGNAVGISIPVTAAANGLVCGQGIIYDSSAGINYYGIAYLFSTTVMTLGPAAATTGALELGAQTFTAALASGDLINISGTYEAAS